MAADLLEVAQIFDIALARVLVSLAGCLQHLLRLLPIRLFSRHTMEQLMGMRSGTLTRLGRFPLIGEVSRLSRYECTSSMRIAGSVSSPS